MDRAMRTRATFAKSSSRLLTIFSYSLLIVGSIFTLSLLTSSSATAAIHGPYTLLGDECASCHRAHTGKNLAVLKSSSPQSNLCFSCHDGTGSSLNISLQYSNNPALVNNAATRVYYSHDLSSAAAHVRMDINEFGGTTNRHSECGDCHNSHSSIGSANIMTSTGWGVSGRQLNVSGVSVVNGAAGTAPTYSWMNGTANQPTREYQICFKCHSGFTTLLAQLPDLPLSGTVPITPQLSKNYLDKGIEFNPANASTHPVEGVGKNVTAKMAASLAGASTYRLWTFTTASTIRCTQCHAVDTAAAAATDLAPHKSANRGILVRPYVDRTLNSANAAYNAGNFALCYTCHATAPFADTSKGTRADSNFPLHGFHLGSIAGTGRAANGFNIDTPGAGAGNAICSECHFRLHSSVYKGGSQTGTDRGLVNFSPNILPNGTTRAWTSATPGTGSCTLTCHGFAHNAENY
jgi:predicted CXXCH cytochrome family protein